MRTNQHESLAVENPKEREKDHILSVEGVEEERRRGRRAERDRKEGEEGGSGRRKREEGRETGFH